MYSHSYSTNWYKVRNVLWMCARGVRQIFSEKSLHQEGSKRVPEKSFETSLGEYCAQSC